MAQLTQAQALIAPRCHPFAWRREPLKSGDSNPQPRASHELHRYHTGQSELHTRYALARTAINSTDVLYSCMVGQLGTVDDNGRFSELTNLMSDRRSSLEAAETSCTHSVSKICKTHRCTYHDQVRAVLLQEAFPSSHLGHTRWLTYI